MTSATQGYLSVYFYDLNNDGGMEDDVYCNVYSCNMSGSTCTSPGTRFGNGTGGSTTSTYYSSGDGYISFVNFTRSALTVSSVWCNVPAADGTNYARIKRFWFNYIY